MLKSLATLASNTWKNNKSYWIISAVFLVIYCLISLVNFINFRTYTLDLGLYTSALWDYAHFQFNDGTTFHNFEENLLADHFDLYLMLFSPLSYLFGSYTLLLVQILFIFIGGAGIVKVLKMEHISGFNSSIALITFYLFFGIFSALGFDYHSNVVASMLVPWLFYHVRKQQYGKGLFLLSTIFIAKENMSIWMFFLSLGLALEDIRNLKKLAVMLSYMVLSATYFLVVTKIIMPHFSASGTYHHFHYDVLGKDPIEAVKTLVTQPISTLKFLVLDINGEKSLIKLEFIYFFFVSGGLFLFRRPSALVMILPLVFQKLFHNNLAMWSVICQYSIEFAPLVVLISFSVVHQIKQYNLSRILPLVLLVSNFYLTLKLMDRVEAPIAKENIRIYAAMHYRYRDIDRKEVLKALAKIPESAAVSTQDPLNSQLAWRDKIYQYPILRDAEYVVFSRKIQNTYPLTNEEFYASIQKLLDSGDWNYLVDNSDISILKRKTPKIN